MKLDEAAVKGKKTKKGMHMEFKVKIFEDPRWQLGHRSRQCEFCK
jgi:hypothetical protein